MKLIVCDVEGTIFTAQDKIPGMDYASTIWQPLARSLGDEGIRREKELHDKWENDEFGGDYLAWVKETYRMHKELGLKRDVFETLINEATYTPGVKEFFEGIDRSKYITATVSGGPLELTNRALEELRIVHGFGASQYFFDRDDGLLTTHSLVPCDFKGKYDYIKNLFRQYALNPNSDWLFIGDGKNDCDIAKRAPISIAINGHEKLKQEVTHPTALDGSDITNFFQIAEIVNSLSDEDFRRKFSEHKKESLMAAHIPYVNDICDQCIKYEKQIDELNRKLKELKQENNDLKGKKKDIEPIEIPSEYECKTPIKHLTEILGEHKVIFVGLKKDYNLYKFLNNVHDNLIVISAEKTRTNFKQFRNIEFLFIFKGCIGHPLAWKAVKELKVPYVNMPPNFDKEKIINIISNTLINELY